MRHSLFIIAGIILLGISLSCLYSQIVISDSQGKLEEIKRTFYLKENTLDAKFELAKGTYLLKIKHIAEKDQCKEIFFNGFKVTANTWPYKRKRSGSEISYIHLPKEIVKQGKNIINITFSNDRAPDVYINLRNYRRDLGSGIYILFSDSAHLGTNKILPKIIPFANILILLLGLMTYLLAKNVFVSKGRAFPRYWIYLLLTLLILLVLFLAGWISSNLGYRVVVTSFLFWNGVFVFLSPFFVIAAANISKTPSSFPAKVTGFLFTEGRFSIPSAAVFSLLIIVTNLWVYWPSFTHLFRHDEWFLFFSSKDETPNLQFIIKHWQLSLPYDRLIFRPIHHIMLALNRVIFDANYIGPHIVTFIKHILATFCLWWLMWQYSPRWISGLFVLLFSVLVVSVDPAMWPHIDAYIVATIFTILAVMAFRKTVYNQISASKGFALTAVLLFLSSLTAEITFLMPLVFFCAYWVVFRNRGEVAHKRKDKRSWLVLLLPMLLWLTLFSLHLYFAYPDFKMTSQSDMIVLWMPFVNVVRFILVLLSGILLPMLAKISYGDKIYFKVSSIGFVLVIVGTLICIRMGRRIFGTITKEIVFLVMLMFSIMIIICFGRASYINAYLNDLSLPSHYVYCCGALIIFAAYAFFDFDKIAQSRKWGLPLLFILGFLTVSHAVGTHHSAVDIESQTAPLRKYFDSVRSFVSIHKKEPDFSFKIIDRPPKIEVFNWYHETCIDGLFARFVNNEKPKYLLKYDYVTEELKYSIYNRGSKPALTSSPLPNIPKGADYINSDGMRFKKVPGQRYDFLMGMFEVTQKQWEDVMGFNPSRFKDDNNPVENVSCYMVQKFIKSLNEMEGGNFYRLPAEQEYVYMAGLFISNPDKEYENIDKYAWLKNNSAGTTHPVGELAPMLTGFYDLVGNVWEWTRDPIEYNSVVKPLKDTPHICFGGSWREDNINPHDSITSYPLDFKYEHLGFRLVREIKGNEQN